MEYAQSRAGASAKLLTKDEARRIAASIKPPLTVVGVKLFVRCQF
jgi:hypothetical protein